MAKTTKIPKRIAGVKLPKELRKVGNALIEQAQSPEGRAMIGKGIGAVAALALAARAQAAHAPAPNPTSTPTGKPAADTDTSDSTASKAGAGAASCPDPVGDAIGAAATMVMGRLFGTKPV